MAALTGTNGVLTIANTTDTYTSPVGAGNPFLPVSALLYASAVSQLVLVDADGVVVLELGVGTAQTGLIIDHHFFEGIRPWKTPIQATTCTAGARLRLYL